MPQPIPSLSRRGFLSGACALGGAYVLSACGGSSSPPGTTTGSGGGAKYTGPKVTVAFWNGWTGADGEAAKQMVDQFNSETSNIKVTMNVSQWEDFFQKLPAAVQSGNGPDIAAMHIDDIPTQAAQQVIVPIDDIAKALKLSESNFAKAVWDGGQYNDKRYGIPIDVHNLGLFYNKDAFEKAGLDADTPPTTHDTYMEALDKLKAAGIQGSWVSPFQFTGGFQFESLLWQFGGDLYDSEVSKAAWDSDAGVQALTWMVDLVDQGYSPKNVAQDADYIALKNGKNALNWQGIWQVNDVTTLTSAKIGLAPLPKIGGSGGVWGNSHQFVLPRTQSSDANKSDAARYFVNWFTRHELDWAKSAKVPADNKLAKSAEFTAMTNLKPFGAEVPDVHFPPSVAGVGDATAKLYDAINKAVLGKSSPEQALSDSAKSATSILESNKLRYG